MAERNSELSGPSRLGALSHAGLPGLTRLCPGERAQLACLLEVSAPKVGNVSPGQSFRGTSWLDFVVSGNIIGQVIDRCLQSNKRVGETILACVQATRKATCQNTNLGLILLLVPLAHVPSEMPLDSGIRGVLRSLTPQDASDVYAAIQLASPGGLGNTDQWDVTAAAPVDLLDAMRQAASRDMIAQEYATDFAGVLSTCTPWLAEELRLSTGEPLEAIAQLHLRLLADRPDTLIARKCGTSTAAQAQKMAQSAWNYRETDSVEFRRRVQHFDQWLRAEGNSRNPGSTADLVGAAIYCLLRDNPGCFAPQADAN